MVRVRIGGLVVMGTVRVRDWMDGFFFFSESAREDGSSNVCLSVCLTAYAITLPPS